MAQENFDYRVDAVQCSFFCAVELNDTYVFHVLLCALGHIDGLLQVENKSICH